jgi:hypothetical protein
MYYSILQFDDCEVCDITYYNSVAKDEHSLSYLNK